MKSNPITTIIGLLVALCPIVGAIFPEAKVICEQLIGELIGLGFIASADGIHVKAPALKSVGMAFILSVAVIGVTACAEYKSLKDSFCGTTTLCEVMKEVKDAAKEEAKDAAREAVKDALKK